MYKKYDIEQLFSIKTEFFNNLKKILKKKRYPTLKAYLQDMIKTGNEWYYFERWQPSFHFSFLADQKPQKFVLYDEREKIEVHCNKEILSKLHSLMKDDKNIKKQLKWSQKIDKLLEEEFKKWKFASFNSKPYLVYDIETTAATKDLTQTKFYLAYAYVVLEPWKWKYKYIDTTNIDSFVQYMLDFDGYIVWYNNVWFDNPVIVYNCKNRKPERIDILNKKSIDIFQFLRNLTWRRMWLNNVATSLIGVSKTLSSGAEWDVLMRQYNETWDEKYLNEFKKYCKNDVQMTVLTLFYLLHYQKIYFNEKDHKYSLEEFIILSQKIKDHRKEETWQNWMFN